jgi:hypothetical protein
MPTSRAADPGRKVRTVGLVSYKIKPAALRAAFDPNAQA